MDQASADQPEKVKSDGERGSSATPLYPKLDPQDLEVPPISAAPEAPDAGRDSARSAAAEAPGRQDTPNAYVISSPAPASSSKRELMNSCFLICVLHFFLRPFPSMDPFSGCLLRG